MLDTPDRMPSRKISFKWVVSAEVHVQFYSNDALTIVNAVGMTV